MSRCRPTRRWTDSNWLVALRGFEAGVIDEARTLAKDLRERSAQHLVGLPAGENKRALELRNRLATLLYDRMNQVRSVARFVFRHHPDLVRKATSAYQRRRRTAANRVRRESETTDPVVTSPFASNETQSS